MKRFLLLSGVALLALLVAACGSSSNAGTSTPQQPTVTLGSTTFATNAITISKGQTITFKDDPTGAMHILVIGKNGAPQTEAGAPDFGGTAGHTIIPGQSWTTPAWNTAGTYDVTCTVHPATMTMTVSVTG